MTTQPRKMIDSDRLAKGEVDTQVGGSMRIMRAQRTGWYAKSDESDNFRVAGKLGGAVDSGHLFCAGANAMKCVRPLICGLVFFGWVSVASAQKYHDPDDGCGSPNPFYYKLDAHRAQLLWA